MSETETEEKSFLKRLLPWLIDIAIGLALALLIKAFVAESYLVPSGSMLNTIQLQDRLIGEKLSYYSRGPKLGEIITFADPLDPNTTLIKRVVALPGQTVDFKDGKLVVDGVAQDEPYVGSNKSYPLDIQAKNLSESISYPYTVPADMYWVMGDNRENSLDSRYFGPISRSSISSHALFVYWPPKDFGLLN